MKIKTIFLVGIILICIFILINTGFALQPQFFGMQVLNEYFKYAKDAFSVTRDKTGIVSYNCRVNLVNDSIYSWGTIEGETITLSITNKSQVPIEMNYYIDTYSLQTEDGSICRLKIKTSITDYPDIVNPKETRWIEIFKPAVIKLGDIEYLAMDFNFNRGTILLKRIEEK